MHTLRSSAPQPRRPRFDHLFAGTIVALALFCPAQLPAQDDEVVATVAGEPITMADVQADIAEQLEELNRQRLMLVESAIGPAVDRRLVEMEAAALGTTANDLLTAQITAKIAPVSGADIDSWFEANKNRLQPGTTVAQVAAQISGLLEQERGQALYSEYLRTLRAKYETRILFEPPRTEIDLADATWKGPEEAPVTLVEFSDFQCPACRGFNPILQQLLDKYPDDVRVAFVQYPLRSIHPQAQGAAEASLCAREAGKFWELHDEMFANQRQLGTSDLKAAARKVGLDGDAFDACLDSNKYAATVQADFDRAQEAGATGTPAVFVNGRQVTPGRVPSLDALSALVEDELRRSQTTDS